MRRIGCIVVFVAALAGAQPALGSVTTLTVVARVCNSFTDVAPNEARNNIQESLADLKPGSTPYKPTDAMNPVVEEQSQPTSPPATAPCHPLAGWSFTLGTGIAGKNVNTLWGALSVVSGPDSPTIVTEPSTPLLDRFGKPVTPTATIAGAATITLTKAQSDLTAQSSKLWIMGGTPAAPVAQAETYAFAALRCAIDNLNGDNVEWIAGPNDGTTHVFCFAYYVSPSPKSGQIIVRKKLDTRGAPAPPSQNVRFTGNISYQPDPKFPDDPTKNFFTVATGTTDQAATAGQASFYRAGGAAWSFKEDAPPPGTELTGVTCTKQGGSTIDSGASNPMVTVHLVAGDVVTCTFTNTVTPRSEMLLLQKQTIGSVGTFNFDIEPVAGGSSTSVELRTTEEGIAVGKEQSLPAGRYRITEHLPQSDRGTWSLDSVFCGAIEVKARPVEILVPDAGRSCIFTNTFTPKGSIVIRKTTLGAGATTSFVIAPGFGTPAEYHQTAVTAESGQTALAEPDTDADDTSALPLGTYYIRELSPSLPVAGTWRLGAVVCKGPRGVVPAAAASATIELTKAQPQLDCTVTDEFIPAPEPPIPPTPPTPTPPPVPTPLPDPGITTQVASADPAASLVLTKRASPTRIRLGQQVRYGVTVRNRGPAIARAVTIVDRQAYGNRRVALHTSKGRCRAAPPRFCIIGRLAPGESAQVTATVRPRSTGTLTNVVATNMRTRTRSVAGQIAAATIVVLPRARRPRFTG